MKTNLNKHPNCPYCGTQCYETSHENWYCPNHGIVYEQNKESLEEKEKSDYIG